MVAFGSIMHVRYVIHLIFRSVSKGRLKRAIKCAWNALEAADGVALNHLSTASASGNNSDEILGKYKKQLKIFSRS